MTSKFGDRRPLSLCDFAWLYRTITTHTDANERSFYLFMLVSGMRRSDLKRLRLDSFSPVDGCIRVHLETSKLLLTLPLGRVGRAIVEERIAAQPPEEPALVFLTKRYTTVPPNTAFYRLRLNGRPGLEVTTEGIRDCWKQVAGTVGLNIEDIARLTGERSGDDIDIETRRAWMQAIEDRTLQLAQVDKSTAA